MSLLHSTLGLAVAVEVPRGQGRNKVNGIHWSSKALELNWHKKSAAPFGSADAFLSFDLALVPTFLHGS